MLISIPRTQAQEEGDNFQKSHEYGEKDLVN